MNTQQRSSFSIKNYIVEQLDERSDIHWNYKDVKDHYFVLNQFKGKKRFVPTFAYRQVLYDTGDSKNTPVCRLCKNIKIGTNSVKLPLQLAGDRPTRQWFTDFRKLFDIEVNNFPYFNKQILICPKRHELFFLKKDLHLLFRFMRYSRFKSALMQIVGSGATISDHAHISICDEDLPIFSLKRQKCFEFGGMSIFQTPDYPGSLYVFEPINTDEKVAFIHRLIGEIKDKGFSYNLYIENTNTVYIILRKAEFSKCIHRKIGSVEAAGIFLGNALGTSTKDIVKLERIIEGRCNRMTAKNFLESLHETVCSKAEGGFVEKIATSLL